MMVLKFTHMNPGGTCSFVLPGLSVPFGKYFSVLFCSIWIFFPFCKFFWTTHTVLPWLMLHLDGSSIRTCRGLSSFLTCITRRSFFSNRNPGLHFRCRSCSHPREYKMLRLLTWEIHTGKQMWPASAEKQSLKMSLYPDSIRVTQRPC